VQTHQQTQFHLQPPTNGDSILLEVDGYYVDPITTQITLHSLHHKEVFHTSANTIQLAINDLESRKAALTGATFTGIASGVTVDPNASNTAFYTNSIC
jgi:hypothetical protein